MLEKRIKALLPESISASTYIGDFPSTLQDAVAIVLFNGAGNAEYFACDTICAPVLKLLVRNRSYEQAQQQVDLIRKVLHKHHDDYFMSIHMRGYPMYLGKDAQKLHEFQVVFNITIKE